MRIALIGQKGIPAASGGVERHVEDLSVHLVKAGHEVTVYVRPHYTQAGLETWQGVRLRHVLSVPTKHLDTITYTIAATLDVLFRRFDIIHYHSIGPSSLLWVVKLFKPRTPVVATFHSRCYLHQKWNWFARAYLRISEYLLCRFADVIFVPSHDLYGYIQHRHARFIDKVRYIPNGVTEKTALPARAITQRWGLQARSYYVLVSRLVPVKGLHHVITAFRQVKSDKRLVIVGNTIHEHAYERKLRALAAGDERIIFVGQQVGDTLAELYSNAAAFIHASEVEGLSISVLEAMAYGLPIAASDIPANREAIGAEGYYVPSADSAALTRLLAAWEQEPPSHAVGASLQARVAAHYDWQKLVNQIAEAYTAIITIKTKKSIRPLQKEGYEVTIN